MTKSKLTNAKRALVTAAIIATLGASVFTAVSTTYAATIPAVDNIHPVSKLVTAIATKFNLDQDEVQAVFDEQRHQQQANMEANLAGHLKKATLHGKLTHRGLHPLRHFPGKGPMSPRLIDDAK